MKTFAELNLIAPIQRSLTEQNYQTPTPIQAQTIPAAMNRNDVLGCAQTGTGKTAAFALPILNRLGKRNQKSRRNSPLALVLAPTRELAIQIGESFEVYGKHLRLRTALVYGGVSQRNQVRQLERGVHILVATPGRLLDLMNQGHVSLDQLQMFVLDEADRMLDMGFLPDLKRIIRELPEQRQSLFFSATMPPNIVELSRQLLTRPISVDVTPKETSVKKIDQRVLFVEKKGKRSLLAKILSGKGVERALVFTKTKRGANQLTEKLGKIGIKAVAIHGNKSQGARQRALDAFRKRHVQVLVATDVAARGIDIDGVTHVVNFDMPIEPESYVHRIGRTGRAGARGIALSLCCGAETGELRAIEKLIGHKIPVDTKLSECPEPKPSRATNAPTQSKSRRSGPKPWEKKRSKRRPGASAEASQQRPARRRRVRKPQTA